MCVMAPPIHLGAWSMLWLPIELINDTTSHKQDDIRKGSHNRDDEMQTPWPNSNL